MERLTCFKTCMHHSTILTVQKTLEAIKRAPAIVSFSMTGNVIFPNQHKTSRKEVD